MAGPMACKHNAKIVIAIGIISDMLMMQSSARSVPSTISVIKKNIRNVVVNAGTMQDLKLCTG